MDAKIQSNKIATYIFPSAFLYSTLLMMALWYLEEGRHDFGFLWSSEIFGFLLFTVLCSSLMIGAYYAIQKWALSKTTRLLFSLFIGGFPTLFLIILIIFTG